MNKNTFTPIPLTTGTVARYDFGDITLHAYQTNDPIDDEVFILEKNGKAVVIESPCFFDNCRELTDYLNGLEIAGILVAYHGAGACFLPDAPKFATANAVDYSANGGGKALIENFAQVFGGSFDASIHPVNHILAPGPVEIGGIQFIIRPTDEAFDVEIPEINAVYTHMLGHDCHSIVGGAAHADNIIAQLKEFQAKGFDLILTSHYTPEDLKDVQTKIEYLETLKTIAEHSPDGEAFKTEIRKQYPAYNGENYLEMTAGAFFA